MFYMSFYSGNFRVTGVLNKLGLFGRLTVSDFKVHRSDVAFVILLFSHRTQR